MGSDLKGEQRSRHSAIALKRTGRLPLLPIGLAFAIAMGCSVALRADDGSLEPYTKQWYEAEIAMLKAADLTEGVVEPSPNLPLLPDVPKRFCTQQEFEDFTENVFKPGVALLEDAFRAVTAYHHHLGTLRDRAKGIFKSERIKIEEEMPSFNVPPAQTYLLLLKFRWDNLALLEANYTKVHERVSVDYATRKAQASLTSAVAVCPSY
jgi:hypothetical protein